MRRMRFSAYVRHPDERSQLMTIRKPLTTKKALTARSDETTRGIHCRPGSPLRTAMCTSATMPARTSRMRSKLFAPIRTVVCLDASMITFNKVSKQYGRQVLFVDASFQLNPGEKVGLVGPNGAGKTTLFRMIVGEESPDEGDVSVAKKMTVGYFRQDVEEMAGRSVLDEIGRA